jgi:hypothetical protein
VRISAEVLAGACALAITPTKTTPKSAQSATRHMILTLFRLALARIRAIISLNRKTRWLTRRPDLGHLKVDLTIEDPKALTKPYSFTRTFTLAPNWDLQEYVCQAILDGIE